MDPLIYSLKNLISCCRVYPLNYSIPSVHLIFNKTYNSSSRYPSEGPKRWKALPRKPYQQYKEQRPPKPRPSVGELMEYIKNGHIQSAERLLQDLEKSNKFKIGIGLNVRLLDMYIKCEQMQPALATRAQLRSQYPQASLLPSKIISLAILMMENNYPKECLQIMEEEFVLVVTQKEGNEEGNPNPSSSSTSSQSGNQPHSNLIDKLCHRLLMIPASKGDTTTTEQLTDLLLHYAYIAPNRAMLGPLVKAHLFNKDYDCTLSLLAQLSVKYKCLPCKSELLNCLVKDKDVDRIQRLVDLSGEIIGLENSLLDLVVCFIENGFIDKAVRLVDDAKLSLTEDRLLYVTHQHLKHDRLDFLLNFLHVLKQCTDDSNSMALAHKVHKLLVDAYDSHGYYDKSEELRNFMKDWSSKTTREEIQMKDIKDCI